MTKPVHDHTVAGSSASLASQLPAKSASTQQSKDGFPWGQWWDHHQELPLDDIQSSSERCHELEEDSCSDKRQLHEHTQDECCSWCTVECPKLNNNWSFGQMTENPYVWTVEKWFNDIQFHWWWFITGCCFSNLCTKIHIFAGFMWACNMIHCQKWCTSLHISVRSVMVVTPSTVSLLNVRLAFLSIAGKLASGGCACQT